MKMSNEETEIAVIALYELCCRFKNKGVNLDASGNDNKLNLLNIKREG